MPTSVHVESASLSPNQASHARDPSESLPKTDRRLLARPGDYSTTYVWYVIALLTIVNVFNYMDRMALSVLLPSIKADLALSDGQVGLLVGFAFALFYAICGIPIARYADRGIRRNVIAISLTVWSIMTALSGAAQNFWQLFMARVGVGAGEAGGLPPAQSILCDYVPVERRSGVFAIHSFGLIVGMMLGMALAGPLSEIIGWRWTCVALGLPGIGVAFIVRLTLREPARGVLDRKAAVKETKAARDESLSPLATLVVLWRCRTFKLLMLSTVMHGFIYCALTQWWPSFYARSFGLSLSSVGLYLGVGLGCGSGLGMLIGGLLSNKGAQRDTKLPLLLGAAGMCLAIPASLGSLLAPSVGVSIMLVFVTGLLWSVPSGPQVATLYSVVPPGMRATAGAISIFFSSVVGFGLGPTFVGFLSDLLASRLGVESLRYALLAPICLMPIPAMVLYAAALAAPADMQRART
jgi:MFS family permease